MKASKRSLKKKARQLTDRLLDCFARWRQLPIGHQVEEKCPFCEAIILIKNQPSDTDASHALPPCDLWVCGLLAAGAHSPRVEDMNRRRAN